MLQTLLYYELGQSPLDLLSRFSCLVLYIDSLFFFLRSDWHRLNLRRKLAKGLQLMHLFHFPTRLSEKVHDVS